MQVGIPKPRIIRATMYMPTVVLCVSLHVIDGSGGDMLTVDGETLNESTDNHDDRAAKDGPATAEPVIDHGDERKRENSTERVGSGNNPLESTLRIIEVCIANKTLMLEPQDLVQLGTTHKVSRRGRSAER